MIFLMIVEYMNGVRDKQTQLQKLEAKTEDLAFLEVLVNSLKIY